MTPRTIDGRVVRPGRLFVLATDMVATTAAMTEAARIVGAGGHISVLLPRLIRPGAVSVDAQASDADIRARAAGMGVSVRVYACACRARLDIFRQMVTEAAIVIVGAGGAPDRDLQALLTALRARGHHVIVAEGPAAASESPAVD